MMYLYMSCCLLFADMHEPPHFLIGQPAARRHFHDAPFLRFGMAHHKARDLVTTAINDGCGFHRREISGWSILEHR